MPRCATAGSLSDYPKMTIASHKVNLKPHTKQITIDYRFHGKAYRYDVGITTTQCNYGGCRYWFICPKCGNRVGVLYCAGMFVCRHCITANYATQLMQPVDKLFHKVAKIRHRLGWHGGIAHGIDERPKGMHNSTYNRLLAEYYQLTEQIIGVMRNEITRP